MSTVTSPNTSIQPITAAVNSLGHLEIGGCDAADLAARFGTPLWVLDQATIEAAARAVLEGLSTYPKFRVLYAGKAFLCLAMVHLIRKLGLGLDVVSPGELHTAIEAGFPADLIYMHGNNKTEHELESGLRYGDVKVVVDSASELSLLASVARRLRCRASVLLRVTPGVEPDTHHYIKTGQTDSKFGLPLEEVKEVASQASRYREHVNLIGLHAHIGSQAQSVEPYLEIVEILADCIKDMKQSLDIDVNVLDLGGGIGIRYTEGDSPVPLYDWARALSLEVTRVFKSAKIDLPTLLLEPGRAIVGTAGVTLYTAGHEKRLTGGKRYIALDGGMADNPRPVTYQARYTPAIASRTTEPTADPLTIVGKYCESGDIIVKDAYLDARKGDIVAVFGTGAYNYSMASNYNRTGRPACVLVSDGQAEVIIERESNADLLRQDRVPDRLLK